MESASPPALDALKIGLFLCKRRQWVRPCVLWAWWAFKVCGKLRIIMQRWAFLGEIMHQQWNVKKDRLGWSFLLFFDLLYWLFFPFAI